ncbi:MAG: hypothetical protein Fur0044_45870 [Anaerolineae bacterium]
MKVSKTPMTQFITQLGYHLRTKNEKQWRSRIIACLIVEVALAALYVWFFLT